MRVTKISVHLSDIYDRERVTPALLAAFAPFGSLTEGVDGTTLAEAMIAWVDAKHGDQPGLASELVRLVWSATTDQTANVEVGVSEVTLWTPTSGTAIRLRRYVGGYGVQVDFGPKGSEGRAANILDAARKVGVDFEAYAGEKKVEDAEILGLLQQQGWGKGQPPPG
ncbi:MAG: hypothetical protein A2842_01105 [Candidatus Wildermuthbacteria bacterium RIFCSPHIGHO2_01_FULL_48_25]|uniref:Uncharacterized protein n=1 Tax=Candidatus Wildermuthbacteria bacterium RIFCSPLOWO2_01_FULL_48_16 TaxID=1802461 RepID=A0A1G2RKR9_9BACT|nr:MAG: hypothetical protein A2842_01105 [Candidatus Wildermuthbacteria bacterium RIFCSPHIGHO2_01_FULL_48_25]OHA69424.1 MAG: hypothetical protein A3J57_02720 [Candidatus Wildermuthbacteria bacterium RIFCSPHIGHO2_02_FULL_49_12b]OHA73407.1 MAG: hypothetical protein A3B24_02240 [Candidatus Wildermuthbacteria bacterium RIFCSPLOWO2_01_FULL_48_16]